MTEQRLGCEEQMKPPAPSLVESRCAEEVKQQLKTILGIVVLIVIAVE